MTALVDHGKHLPASHPLVAAREARLRRLVQRDAAAIRVALQRDESEREQITETLEQVGRMVARLPDTPFDVQQRVMGSLIVRELHRRSRVTGDRERLYQRSPNVATQKRNEAIIAAVRDSPERRLRDIGATFGVSSSFVSQLAISNGARRRVKTLAGVRT